MRSVRLLALLAIGALACTRASFHEEETGDGGHGGGVSGMGGTAGTGQGGGGTGMGGSIVGGSGGTGGSAGTGTGGTGTAGSAGTGGRGGTTGGAGTGGTGTAGSGGRGGTTGIAGTGGTGTAGSGGTGGRGGTTGSAGTGGTGTAGSGGTGGRGGTTGVGGTGGSPPMMPSTAGQIVITELMNNSATVADDYGEWFEIYNPSTTVTYDLMGCQVLDSSLTGPTIATSLVIPPGAFRTLAVSATPGGPGGTAFTPDYVYTVAVKFDNDAGERAAISCNGMLIDDFVYPSAVAGTGGRTFSLDPRHYNAADNDVSMTYWCFARNTVAGDAYEPTGPNYGTPGATNPQCPGVAQ